MKLNLGKRNIGDNEAALIVAEVSANHLQDFNMGIALDFTDEA